MSSTTAGTVTAASPTSSSAKGRPPSRGRPSARPLLKLGSAAGRGDPGGGRQLGSGLGGPGVDGGWAPGLGPWGGWAPGSATASCSPGHVVLAPPHCEDRRAGRQTAPRSPARVSPHDDLHNRRHCELAHSRARARLTTRRIHGREDRRAGSRGEHAQGRGSALTTIFTSGCCGGPYGMAPVRGRACRSGPGRTASLPYAAVPSTDHVRHPASAGEADVRRINGRRRAARRTPWPGGGAARRR